MRMSAGFGAGANFYGPSLAACLGALRFGARLVRTEFLLERSVQSFGPGLGVFGARLGGLRLRLGGLRAPLRSPDPLLGLTGARLGVLRPLLGRARGGFGRFSAPAPPRSADWRAACRPERSARSASPRIGRTSSVEQARAAGVGSGGRSGRARSAGRASWQPGGRVESAYKIGG